MLTSLPVEVQSTIFGIVVGTQDRFRVQVNAGLDLHSLGSLSATSSEVYELTQDWFFQHEFILTVPEGWTPPCHASGPQDLMFFSRAMIQRLRQVRIVARLSVQHLPIYAQDHREACRYILRRLSAMSNLKVLVLDVGLDPSDDEGNKAIMEALFYSNFHPDTKDALIQTGAEIRLLPTPSPTMMDFLGGIRRSDRKWWFQMVLPRWPSWRKSVFGSCMCK